MAKPLDINRKIDCRLFQLLVDIEVSQVFTHIIFWIVHPTYVTLAHTLVFGCRLCCFMTHPMKHYSNVPIINLIMLFGSIIFLLSLSLSLSHSFFCCPFLPLVVTYVQTSSACLPSYLSNSHENMLQPIFVRNKSSMFSFRWCIQLDHIFGFC